MNQPEIHEVASAAIRAQQRLIDRLLDILEEGDAINHAFAITYRDDAQAERMRRIRDKLHPDCEWAKRRAKGDRSVYDSHSST